MDNDKDKEKTPLEKQRESIEVTTSSPTGDEEDNKETGKEIEEGEKETTEVEAAETAAAEAKEELEELEDEKKEAKDDKEKARIQRRMDKLTAKAKAAEDRVKELEAQLAEKGDAGLTEEEVERRAEAKAIQKQIEKEFERDCNKLAKDATKEDKDFKTKVDAMAEDIGPIPSQMIGVLADLDKGGAVLSYLTNNISEAEDIYALANNPGKLALALKKIEDGLNKKPPPKEVSKVPPPNPPLGGKGASPDVLSDKEPMEDWVAKRNKQAAERAANKRAGMH